MIFLWEKLVIAKRRHVGKPIRVREIFSVCMAASLERRGFIKALALLSTSNVRNIKPPAMRVENTFALQIKSFLLA